MARVDFYHLTRDPAPQVVARLADRVLATKERLLVIAADKALLEAVDGSLWSAIPESFLPHSVATAPVAEQSDEPVILAPSFDQAIADGPSIAAIADGEWRDEALAFARSLFLFDGSQIDHARAVWRNLSKRDGVQCHYWKQDSAGRWKEGP